MIRRKICKTTQNLHVIQVCVFRNNKAAMNFVDEFTSDEKLKIKHEFSRLKDFHYLDFAGSALYGESQIRQISDVLTGSLFCNPHTSKSTENLVDQARYR
jgi:molybdenum cofactor sulfurtransferase